MTEYAGREQEEAIEAREKAATLGDWLAKEGQTGPIVVTENPQVATVLVAVISSSGKRGRADAEFTAHAKQDIPYLLAQLREAREEDVNSTLAFGVAVQQRDEAREKLAAVEKRIKFHSICFEESRCTLPAELLHILKGGD